MLYVCSYDGVCVCVCVVVGVFCCVENVRHAPLCNVDKKKVTRVLG